MLFDLNKKNKNMSKQYLFTSESVSEGHPDKVCDIISNSIVDDFLKQKDPENSRIAMETLVTTNKVVMAGEVRGPMVIAVIMSNLLEMQLKKSAMSKMGFIGKIFLLIALVFIASQRTSRLALMPLQIRIKVLVTKVSCLVMLVERPLFDASANIFSHKILEQMASDRKSGKTPGIQPDSKSQVTLEYKDGHPEKCTKVVVSTQHDKDLDQKGVSELVIPIIKQTIPDKWINDETQILINPTGKFVIGGPDGDTGLTGRKIIVDTYGGAAPTVEEHSQAKIQLKLIDLLLTLRGIFQKYSCFRNCR